MRLARAQIFDRHICAEAEAATMYISDDDYSTNWRSRVHHTARGPAHCWAIQTLGEPARQTTRFIIPLCLRISGKPSRKAENCENVSIHEFRNAFSRDLRLVACLVRVFFCCMLSTVSFSFLFCHPFIMNVTIGFCGKASKNRHNVVNK